MRESKEGETGVWVFDERERKRERGEREENENEFEFCVY